MSEEPTNEPSQAPEPVTPSPETPIVIPKIDFMKPPTIEPTEVRKEFGGTPVGPTGPAEPADPGD